MLEHQRPYFKVKRLQIRPRLGLSSPDPAGEAYNAPQASGRMGRRYQCQYNAFPNLSKKYLILTEVE